MGKRRQSAIFEWKLVINQNRSQNSIIFNVEKTICIQKTEKEDKTNAKLK